jgi:hypothetical protein
MFDERAFVFCTLKIGISYKVKKEGAPERSPTLSGQSQYMPHNIFTQSLNNGFTFFLIICTSGDVSPRCPSIYHNSRR